MRDSDGRPGEVEDQSVAPAVFGAEYAGYEQDVAQTVYLLCQRVGPQDREARVELRQDDDQRQVMLAYSSLDELVSCCGEAQPWVSVPTDRVSQVQQDVGAELVLWDVDLPAQLRHTLEEGGQA